MKAISSKLQRGSDGQLFFWCPGCDMAHGLQVGDGGGPRWVWDGNVDAPTFHPSVLVRFEHWVPPWPLGGPKPKYQDKVRVVCHSYVRGGRLEYLVDCTHDLAGKTVDLPDWPADMAT